MAIPNIKTLVPPGISLLTAKIGLDNGVHFISLPIGIEETEHSFGLLERLDQSVEQNPVKAAVTELDAILVVFDEGVHRRPPCGQIPGAYSHGRLPVYALIEIPCPEFPRSVGVAQSA
jgi:hypothetical protein